MATKNQSLGDPKQVDVYILDPCDDDDDFDGIVSGHFQKQKKFRRTVKTYFDCQVHDVWFQNGSEAEDVIRYFKNELRTKTKAHLMIIYFEGGGGEEDENYAWKFSGYPKKDIDAYKLIQLFVNSGINVMIVLDAYIPTRFTNRWKVEEQENMSRPDGNVEIVARGPPAQKTDGSVKHEHISDFSRNLIGDLSCLVTGINKPTQKITTNTGKVKVQKGFRKYTKPMSIPQLLKENKLLNANPIRICIKRPKAGDETIARFVMDPNHIRKTGKISWFAQIIQAPRPKVAEQKATGYTSSGSLFKELHDDEGFSED